MESTTHDTRAPSPVSSTHQNGSSISPAWPEPSKVVHSKESPEERSSHHHHRKKRHSKGEEALRMELAAVKANVEHLQEAEKRHQSIQSQHFNEMRALRKALELNKDYYPETSSSLHNNSNVITELQSQVSALQKAFSTLSDVVCDEIDAIRVDLLQKYSEVDTKSESVSRSLLQLKAQVVHFANNADQDRVHLRQNVVNIHSAVSKLEARSEESRISVASLSCQYENLVNQAREASRRLEGTCTTTDQLSDWVHHLKAESASTRHTIHAMKEDSKNTSNSLVLDVEALGSEVGRIRVALDSREKSTNDSLTNMSDLVETNRKENISMHESQRTHLHKSFEQLTNTTSTAFQNLSRDNAKVRIKIDEDLRVHLTQFTDLKKLVEKTSEELKVLQSQSCSRLIQNHSNEWQRKFEAITKAVHSLANILNASAPPIINDL